MKIGYLENRSHVMVVVRRTAVIWTAINQPSLKTFPTSRHTILLLKKGGGVTVLNSKRYRFAIEEKYLGFEGERSN